MEMLVQFIGPYWRNALSWWHSLGPAGPYYVWLASGILGLLFWAWLSYLLIRRLLGHKKIHGVWFKPGQIDPVLDRLELSEKSGTILHARDVDLLDKYRPDRKLHLKRIGDSDYVSW